MGGFIKYALVVLVFGTFMGLSNSMSSTSPLDQPFIAGYVFQALLWGGLFFNGLLHKLELPTTIKLFSILALALAASTIAYLYYSTFAGGEVAENLLAGWGDDPSTYKEYPIKGYELIGLVFFVIYIAMGFAVWFFSLIPNPKEGQR